MLFNAVWYYRITGGNSLYFRNGKWKWKNTAALFSIKSMQKSGGFLACGVSHLSSDQSPIYIYKQHQIFIHHKEFNTESFTPLIEFLNYHTYALEHSSKQLLSVNSRTYSVKEGLLKVAWKAITWPIANWQGDHFQRINFSLHFFWHLWGLDGPDTTVFSGWLIMVVGMDVEGCIRDE